MKRRLGAVFVASAMALASATGCSSDDANAGEAELQVFAASSLTEAFTEMAEVFEREHDGVAVRLTFGASSSLARQIEDGAGADVFASADAAAMDAARGELGASALIARNRLVIVVEPGNPRGVDGLESLGEDLVVVLCAPEVPCGRYAAAALQKAGVSVRPASLEENVKAVVAKVKLGEADAGIVYATDAIAAGDDVTTLDIAADASLDAAYPMAIVKDSDRERVAREWIRFVRSRSGQTILERHGFLAP